MDAPIALNNMTASTNAPTVVDEKQTVPAAGAGMTQPAPAAVLEAENPEKHSQLTPGKHDAAAETPVEEGVEQNEEGVEYPGGFKLAVISVSLCFAVFLVALDQTIIATAIPRITDYFNALDDVGWYGSSYLLTTCAFQLMFGKLYTFFSIKIVFLAAIGVFELGSLICGVAPTSTALIIGRAIAGMGTSGIFSGALIIIAHSVPLRTRPIYTGIIGAMYGVASVAGPLLGGVFTDKVSWRWCFYINLPIGAVTIAGIMFFFKSPRREKITGMTKMQKFRQFDPLGTALFIPAIVCLLLALQWGGSRYAWGSGRVIALFVVFGLLIIPFIILQLVQGDAGTLPPRIMKQRSIAFCAFYVLCIGSAFFIFIFYLPIWFQAIKGDSAVKSGIDNLPMILGVVILSIISGGIVTVIGYYTPFMIASSVIMAVGAGLLTTLEVDTPASKWIGYQAILGIGIGMGLQQTFIAVQTVLPMSDIAMGTTIVVFLQTLGGALFIAVAQNVFTNKLEEGLVGVANLEPGIVLRTGATSLKNVIPRESLPGVLVAYNAAITETFYVGVAMASLTIIGSAGMEWKSVKGKKITAGGAA
ncbi:MAG: MFS sugar transporter [Watsoniomyces obsoletus]|nr:MAG: MFS sugar transporter [Watsoniomyces obsoletus]